MESQWRDAAWQARAHEWIDAQLAPLSLSRVGDIEQPHIYPWSTVLRVPTGGGSVWFKANVDTLRHEATLVGQLSRRRPDCVPPLLAVDEERGWMLMSDAGESLRVVVPREQSLDRWLDALRLYSGVQLDLRPDVDAMLAAGVPDRRLAILPAQYAHLMDLIDADQRFRDAQSSVVSLCERLAAFEIAETIQHDDLHDGQVFVRDGHNLLLDWGDACISHPFFTLSVTLEGVLSWGLDDVEDSVDTAPFRDAYLEAFAEIYEGDLIEAATLATRLGWACRAVNGHLPGDDKSTFTRLRMFLDGKP